MQPFHYIHVNMYIRRNSKSSETPKRSAPMSERHSLHSTKTLWRSCPSFGLWSAPRPWIWPGPDRWRVAPHPLSHVVAVGCRSSAYTFDVRSAKDGLSQHTSFIPNHSKFWQGWCLIAHTIAFPSSLFNTHMLIEELEKGPTAHTYLFHLLHTDVLVDETRLGSNSTHLSIPHRSKEHIYVPSMVSLSHSILSTWHCLARKHV